MSDEDGDVFGGSDNKLHLPSEVLSSPSSGASLSMCYMNEVATDDDDDYGYDNKYDVDKKLCGSVPLGSPDLIAGMRRPPPELSVSCSNEHYHVSSALSTAQITSTEFHGHKELDRETGVRYSW